MVCFLNKVLWGKPCDVLLRNTCCLGALGQREVNISYEWMQLVSPPGSKQAGGGGSGDGGGGGP